jgi:hypothetical protein
MVEAKKPQDRKPKAVEPETHRKVKVDGREFEVAIAALSSPRTMDDLGLMQEVHDITLEGDEIPKELSVEVALRMPGLLRRLIGFAGARSVHAHLEKKHGDEYNIGHLASFVVSLIGAIAPNS